MSDADKPILFDRPAKPEKGTPEYNLWIAAIEVATYPPLTGTGFTTQVPRSRIDALRTALDAVGIDWAKAKRMDDNSRKKRNQNVTTDQVSD